MIRPRRLSADQLTTGVGAVAAALGYALLTIAASPPEPASGSLLWALALGTVGSSTILLGLSLLSIVAVDVLDAHRAEVR